MKKRSSACMNLISSFLRFLRWLLFDSSLLESRVCCYSLTQDGRPFCEPALEPSSATADTWASTTKEPSSGVFCSTGIAATSFTHELRTDFDIVTEVARRLEDSALPPQQKLVARNRIGRSAV